MNWKDIHLNEFDKVFYHQGQPVFSDRGFSDALPFHSPGLAPVQDNSGWYHINPQGAPVYANRFLRAFGFYQERAAVVSQRGWFHIDTSGRPITTNIYDWCGNYQEDLCTVRDTFGSYFHIDKSGKKSYHETYRYAGDFRKGFACVMNHQQQFTHIDSQGRYLHGYWFLDLGVFHKGFAVARDSSGWFHIDYSGQPIYNHRFSLVEPFYNGRSFATTLNSNKVLVNEKGEVAELG